MSKDKKIEDAKLEEIAGGRGLGSTGGQTNAPEKDADGNTIEPIDDNLSG